MPNTKQALIHADGGGVRGYSELAILEQLMLGIRQYQKLSSTPKPCEIFDMICGTSTGGIIALMLGRLRMSMRIPGTYTAKCPRTFSKNPRVGRARKEDTRQQTWKGF